MERYNELQEMNKKSNFISQEYTKLARKINRDIAQMFYVKDSNTKEEYLVIEYNTGYKKILNITANSLTSIVSDTINKI